jgi:crotonobetainyl-CoA:carnitine CoA-transferase CaiB-like acyl-CoA transferase
MGILADQNRSGLLDGIRVLDLSRVLAGPWAGQLLADYGADVIKVERPRTGDDTRGWGPPWLEDSDGNATADSAYYLAANRNKRSITIDLGNPRGAEIVRRLAESADVFLENFRVGTAKEFGLDYAALSQVNKRLVYCSISAFGQSGSRADEPGYDAMIQASAGLMSLTGTADEDGGSPQKVGVAIADIMAGMYATSGILAALVARSESGKGQYLDVPLYDSQVAWLANQNMNYLVGGITPQRMGTAHPNLVPYRVFATQDGHLMLAVGNDRQFRDCVAALGKADLAEDPAFLTNADRVEHRQDLEVTLEKCFMARTTEEWLATMSGVGVPAGPINSIDQVFSAPYAAEKGLVRQVRHMTAGDIPTVANPVNFSHNPVQYRFAPPELGQHTTDILGGELGIEPAELQSLRDDGVI